MESGLFWNLIPAGEGVLIAFSFLKHCSSVFDSFEISEGQKMGNFSAILFDSSHSRASSLICSLIACSTCTFSNHNIFRMSSTYGHDFCKENQP